MATPSIDAPATPLRQRMQQDMLMRGLGVEPQQVILIQAEAADWRFGV